MPPHCPKADTLKKQSQTLKKLHSSEPPTEIHFKREREKKHLEELCNSKYWQYTQITNPGLHYISILFTA